MNKTTASGIFAELAGDLSALESAGLKRRRRTLEAPCGPLAVVDGRELISFCSNDYLGLANDPALIAAARIIGDNFEALRVANALHGCGGFFS